jgi:hypothetical protein
MATFVQGINVAPPPPGWCQTANCGRKHCDGTHGLIASGHHCHECACLPLADFGRCVLADLSCPCRCHQTWRFVNQQPVKS